MKLFITGATGGLGKTLISRLSALQYQLVLLHLPTEILEKQKGIEYVAGNILDPLSYQPALSGVDAVIHLAAITHTNKTSLYFKINTEGTKLLLAAAQASRVKRFIYISTRAIDERGGGYSASKAQAEALVQASPLSWTILRPSEVCGASQGEAITTLMSSITTMPFIPIVGDGQYRIAPVHIDDVIEAIVRVVLSEPRTTGKTYTIAGPHDYSYDEFVDRLLEKYQLKKVKIHVPVFFIRLLAWGLSLLPIKKPFLVRDQIPRLLCPKSAVIDQAKSDFGFNPRDIVAEFR
jgi:NADH dehydrogenase